jgi:hypothetical protein
MLRIPEILLGALLAVAIIATGMTFSSSQPLQQAEQHTAAEQHAPDKVGEHDNKTQSLWVPTDSVGLYTLVLAVFTGLLVGVSIFQGYFLLRADKTARTTADAAMLSARAAIGIELPVIRSNRIPGLIRLSGPPEPKDFSGGGVYIQDAPGQYSIAVGFEFQNFGRTPAFPVKFETGWKVIPDLPSLPDYFTSTAFPPTAIIKAEGGEINAPRIQTAIELTTEEQALLKAKAAPLWLYISLHYRDFMNQPHEARFCWRGYGSFGTGGNPPTAYTSYT